MSTWRPISPPPFWQRWLPECLHGPLGFVMRLAVLVLLALAAVALFYYMLALRFDLGEVARLPAGTTYYDRAGAEISAPGGVGRKLVRRDEIPPFLVRALQAREDARFFDHHGVDVRGLLRATLRNLKDRDFTQGASTLSMQLVRNCFQMKQKSLHRKLLEIALTLRVEGRYSKDEILTHYLNRIYFGSGADGIEQAARTYFGKTTRELTDGEAALVVGIIRGPHIYSPLRNLTAALEQRAQTLDRLVAMGVIDAARRQVLAAEPVRLVADEQRETQTSYALQAIARELERICDEQGIEQSGLNVSTTLDSAWQRRLETELTRAVEQLEKEKNWPHPRHKDYVAGTEGGPAYLQYAVVTTEMRSGAILALIGGRDFGDSRFDRTRSKRDLGSVFEPFVAAAAAERGKLVLAGRPVQTGRQIGPAEVERIVRRCGLSSRMRQTEDLFRGDVAATPLELSVGLATLGNKGRRAVPYLIREIRDASGEVLYRAKPQSVQAISPAAALDARSVLRSSGGTRCFTGATGSERDAWTLRLGPSGATAIWIGFDKPTAVAGEPRLQSLLEEFVKRLGND